MTVFRAAALMAMALLSACSGSSTSPSYTLYRNSSVDPSMRIHWATFDANESGATYNMNNCMMGARLLNANIKAMAAKDGHERAQTLGFWCEPGGYSDKGMVPMTFDAAFPTDTP